MKNKSVVLLLVSLILFLTACSPSSSSVQTAIAQTQESEASAVDPVVISDEINVQTLTTEPYHTVEPTQIPSTPTPIPSSTLEPTIAPEPLVISGTGDSVVDIDWPDRIGLMRVKGNASGRYFGIVPYDENGNRISSIVNTADPYEGLRPFNFDGDNATRLEISASGEWSIEIIPISEANKILLPGTYTGRGDDVIILTGGIPDLAIITGNAESRYFGVIPYTENGNRLSSIVNTADPYEGTVIIPRDAIFLEIISEGDWVVSITAVD